MTEIIRRKRAAWTHVRVRNRTRRNPMTTNRAQHSTRVRWKSKCWRPCCMSTRRGPFPPRSLRQIPHHAPSYYTAPHRSETNRANEPRPALLPRPPNIPAARASNTTARRRRLLRTRAILRVHDDRLPKRALNHELVGTASEGEAQMIRIGSGTLRKTLGCLTSREAGE